MLLFLVLNRLYSQENYISNGNLEDNKIFVFNESIELPYLDNFSPIRVEKFKGEYYYPFPDSTIFIGLRYGRGFYNKSNRYTSFTGKSDSRNSEIYGVFNSSLKKNAIYKFSLSITPYWGNIKINDKVVVDFLDSEGKLINHVNMKILCDSPFLPVIHKFNFKANGVESRFHIYFDSLVNYNVIKTPYFIDSINRGKREREILIAKEKNDSKRLDFFLYEKKMRDTTPFVYYLTNSYDCSLVFDRNRDSICFETISNDSYTLDIHHLIMDSNTLKNKFLNLNESYRIKSELKIYTHSISTDLNNKIYTAIQNQLRQLLPIDFNINNLEIKLSPQLISPRSKIKNQIHIILLKDKCKDDDFTILESNQ